MSKIQILLATYNGSRHLEAFLESLLSQGFRDWSLLVRDDGSTDSTPALLESWRSSLRDRMQILPDSNQCNLGVVGNFSRLLTTSTAPYVMFADQDDIWHPDKISLTLNAMSIREAEVGTNIPILAHTDLTLVDEQLQVVAPSYWRHQGIFPEKGHSLGHMMVENIASGCTSMMNRCLADLAGEIPREAGFQDWWISLVAAAFGEIVSVPVQTISWRRHAANSSDITKLSEVFRQTLIAAPTMRRHLASLLQASRPRVRVFLSRYRDHLTPSQIASLEAFLRLPELGFFQRRLAVLQHHLFFTSWSRTAGLFLFL